MSHKFKFCIFIFFIINLNIFKSESFNPFQNEIKKIFIGDSKTLKIGIIGDFQLSVTRKEIYYKFFSLNLKDALLSFKKKNLDIIIMTGDITDDGEVSSYEEYEKIFNSVFDSQKDKIPLILPIMGNHDYNHTNNRNDYFRELFYKHLHSYPYMHYIINNYNFILWSNSNGILNDGIGESEEWIQTHLKLAQKNKHKNGDPIFVITHMHPYNTCYGSLSWGSPKIYEILKNYPEIINISGHSHYSLINHKSFWQGDFTVLNTQSTSYVDLDATFINYQETLYVSGMCGMEIIANLNEGGIEFERIFIKTEEKINETWKINFPIDLTKKIKLDFDKPNKPFFEKNSEIILINKNKIKFNKAKSLIPIHYYTISFISQDFLHQFNYLFDFYNKYFCPSSKNNKNPYIEFSISKFIKLNKKYLIEIKAVDVNDNISEILKQEIILF